MTHSHCIAIVDDNLTQRMILTRLLEKDYTVASFDSGSSFLPVCRFDAVLLDGTHIDWIRNAFDAA